MWFGRRITKYKEEKLVKKDIGIKSSAHSKYRCQYHSVPLRGAKPAFAPYRGRANHQFTGGYDKSNT